MRNWVLLVLMGFVLPEMSAQSNVDSIRKKINAATEDSTRIQLLLDLGYEYESSLPDSALAVYDRAYRLSSLANDDTGKGKARQFRGIVLTELGRYAEAVIAYEEAIRHFKKDHNQRGEANTWNNLGNTYLYLASYEDAVEAYLKAIPYYEKMREQASLVISYGNLGECYRQLGEYPAMLAQCRKMYTVARGMGDPYEIGNAAISLGAALSHNGQLDSASYYLESAYRTGLEMKDASLIFYSLYDLCDADLKAGLNKEALIKSDSAMNAAKQWGRAYAIVSARILQGRSLEANKKTKEARIAFEEALNMARIDGSREQQLQALLRLSGLNESSGNYAEALSYSKQWIALNDSVYNAQKTRQISELRTIYETAEKDRLLSEEKERSAEKDLVIERRTVFLIAAGSLIILLLITAWLVIRNLRHRKVLAEKEASIQREKAHVLEKEQEALRYKNESLRNAREADYLRAMVEGQEEERRRIGRELHDGLGGLVTAARIGLDEIGRESGNAIPVELFLHVRNLLTRSSQDLREVSHNLAPEGLEALGLVESLRNLCRNLSVPHLPIDFELHGTERSFGKVNEVHIYRIVQELLNNILKHSGATAAFVSLSFTPEELTLVVEDNGIGLSKEQAGQGNGLRSIHARSTYLNASIDILSGTSKGTSFSIHIPAVPDAR